MIKSFTEWMREARFKSTTATCPKCGESTSSAELNSYNGECENCWNRGKGAATLEPQIHPQPKGGRRVVHKPGLFGG